MRCPVSRESYSLKNPRQPPKTAYLEKDKPFLRHRSLLAAQAGFRVDLIERVREPSTKYTLRAFLVRPSLAD